MGKFFKRFSISLFKRRSFKNACWGAIDYIYPLILFLLTTPFILKKLGTELFGIWMLCNAMSGFLGLFAFGFGNAIVKFVAEYFAKDQKEMIRKIVGFIFFIYLVMGSVVTLFIILTSTYWVNFFKIEKELRDVAKIAIALSGIGFFLNLFIQAISCIPKALQRYEISNSLRMAFTTFRTFSVIFLLYAGYKLIPIILANLGINFLSIWGYYIASRKLLRISIYPFYSTEGMKKVFCYGSWATLGEIGGTLFHHIDKLLLSHFCPVSLLPFYSIPERISQALHGFLVSLFHFLFPLISSIYSIEKDRVERIYYVALKLTLILCTCIAMPLFTLSAPFLRLWVGDVVSQHSFCVLKLLMLHNMFLASTIAPYFFLNAIGKIKISTLFGLFSGIITLVFAILLIPRLGIVGAALARISFVLVSIPAFIYYELKILSSKKWWQSLLIIYKILLLSLLIGVVFQKFLPPSKTFWEFLFNVFVVFFCVSIFCIFLEKKTLKSILTQ